MPKRKTTEEYKNEVERVTNNEYTILTEYKTANDKILFKHLKCGREYYATPKNFNKGRRCAHCSNNKTVKTKESFKKEIKEYGNDKYELIGEYGMNNKEKVTLLHKVCNKQFQITPYNFLNGHGCPYCFKRNILKTTKQFKEEVKKLSNNEYEVLSEYTGWNNKITFLHKKCNKLYKATPTKFIIGRRCPYCSESKGEIKIRTFLDEHNIKYKRQYKFSDLYDKDKNNPLKFDFYLEDFNLLIEFDGIQHFKKCWYDTDEDLQDRKQKDKLKTEYCNKNNYSLLRIKYTELKNVDNILKKELKFND